MKKVISPIIHAAFLIPLLIIAMGSFEFIARTYGLLPNYIRVFEMPYIFLSTSIIIISGVPVFWLANRLIQGLEKLQNPTIFNHFRQSIFFYFIIIYCLTTWIYAGFRGNVDDLYFLTLSSFSLVSIIVNSIFLFRNGQLNNA